MIQLKRWFIKEYHFCLSLLFKYHSEPVVPFAHVIPGTIPPSCGKVCVLQRKRQAGWFLDHFPSLFHSLEAVWVCLIHGECNLEWYKSSEWYYLNLYVPNNFYHVKWTFYLKLILTYHLNSKAVRPMFSISYYWHLKTSKSKPSSIFTNCFTFKIF